MSSKSCVVLGTFLVVFILNVSLGEGASVKESPVEENPPLLFLGKFTRPKRSDVKTTSASTQQTSYYFLSQNAAGWSTSANDCKAFLGEDATLLFIETQEELGAVTKFLQNSDDTGATYWAGGRYNVGTSKFNWGNGVEVESWAPWDAGHPDSALPVSRISVYRPGGGLTLRTQFQTVSNRYICELAV